MIPSFAKLGSGIDGQYSSIIKFMKSDMVIPQKEFQCVGPGILIYGRQLDQMGLRQ
jgi:hypothetical protein